MALTTAPFPFWWLAWVGLVPLWVWTRRTQGVQEAAGIGFCWGVGYYGVVLSWVLGLHPLTWLGMSWSTSLAIAILIWLFVTFFAACIPGLWALGFRRLSAALGIGPRLLVGVTLWCLLEGLWSQSPLWWPDIANSQSPHNLAIAHLGQLSGLTTLTVALLLVNGLLAEAILTRQRKYFGLAILVGLGLHGLGWSLMSPAFSPATLNASLSKPSLSNPSESNPSKSNPSAIQEPNRSGMISVGLIQGNIPTRVKLSPLGVQTSVEVYQTAYQALARQGVDAVLLPEGALPFLWGKSPYDQTLRDTIQSAQVPLWAGIFVPAPVPAPAQPPSASTRQPQQAYHQSLIELSGQDGTIQSQYNKVKLVPLGEYLPFSEQLGQFITRLSPIQMSMIPGTQGQTFKTALGQATVGICYDSAFPELFRTQTARGGQFILSIANNDPYNDQMLAQHHALDVLRAIESDRWLLRATNTGLSAIITPQGKTQWQSQPRIQTTHIAQIQRRTTQTLYVRYGNWLLPMLGFSSLVLCLIGLSRSQTPTAHEQR